MRDEAIITQGLRRSFGPIRAVDGVDLAAPAGTVLGLLSNGWSNRRIAEECFLSLNTVRTHVQNVLVKLGVHSKLEAVAFALEHQVVAAGAGTPAWAGSSSTA